LRNNPIYKPVKPLTNPYNPEKENKLPIDLRTDENGRLIFEGYLNAWFMNSFASGKLKEIIGEYGDFINYVPTSFNKIMDIFLTNVTNIDGIDILHNYTCIELKSGIVKEDNLNQIIMYENWIIRKLAQGDTEMVNSILVGFDFDEKVIQYRNKRKNIEKKIVRLIKYRVEKDKNNIVLEEI